MSLEKWYYNFLFTFFKVYGLLWIARYCKLLKTMDCYGLLDIVKY